MINQGATITKIFCLAYMIGLIITLGWPDYGGYCLLLLGLVIGLILPNWQRQLVRLEASRKQRRSQVDRALKKGKNRQANVAKTEPKTTYILPQWVWFTAGLIGLLASVYYQLRLPAPMTNDISQLLKQPDLAEKSYIVSGMVDSNPRLTCGGQSQFWLNVNQVSEIEGEDGAAKVNQDMNGRLYVTAPLLQTTGLYPGMTVSINGKLSQPQRAANPGSFDFAEYLANQGSFTTMWAQKLDFSTENPPLGWWVIRRKIVRPFVENLDVPAGSLLGAMVLGKQAVDIPCDVRDQMIKLGLAHILAASGFQVSLILAVVIALTSRFSGKITLICGIIISIIYIGLTEVSPSVLRAGVMGVAVLAGIAFDKKLNSLGSLLAAAIVLLLCNPIWIKDVGFQLSFTATLGLLVTAQAIVKKLDWLPPVISSLVAVPIAAMIWTLPLQLYYFYVISPYSIIVNIITAPLISIISLGGMLAGVVALISHQLGGWIAGLLKYPMIAFLGIVEYAEKLSGSAIAVGSIEIWQVVVIYSLICLVWHYSNAENRQRNRWFQQILGNWLIAGGTIGLIIAIPVWWQQKNLFQTTILATKKEAVMTIQARGEVFLFNSGSEGTVKFNILPFLREQGINLIDWAIAPPTKPNTSNGWRYLLDNLPIQVFYDIIIPDQENKETSDRDNSEFVAALKEKKGLYLPMKAGQKLKIGTVEMQLLDAEIPVIQWSISPKGEPDSQKIWLLLGNGQQNTWPNPEIELKPVEVLWWPGDDLSEELLNVLKPKVAIAYSANLDPNVAQKLEQNQVQVFWTSRDGAITWTPAQGFSTKSDFAENNNF